MKIRCILVNPCDGYEEECSWLMAFASKVVVALILMLAMAAPTLVLTSCSGSGTDDAAECVEDVSGTNAADADKDMGSGAEEHGSSDSTDQVGMTSLATPSKDPSDYWIDEYTFDLHGYLRAFYSGDDDDVWYGHFLNDEEHQYSLHQMVKRSDLLEKLDAGENAVEYLCAKTPFGVLRIFTFFGYDLEDHDIDKRGYASWEDTARRLYIVCSLGHAENDVIVASTTEPSVSV